MTGLDAVDHALLRELQEDARRSNRELAAAVHVSPSTSSERVRALRLVAMNVLGSKPGESDASSFGHPGKFTLCLAEDPPPALALVEGRAA